jgi:hypothetical protein
MKKYFSVSEVCQGQHPTLPQVPPGPVRPSGHQEALVEGNQTSLGYRQPRREHAAETPGHIIDHRHHQQAQLPQQGNPPGVHRRTVPFML